MENPLWNRKQARTVRAGSRCPSTAVWDDKEQKVVRTWVRRSTEVLRVVRTTALLLQILFYRVCQVILVWKEGLWVAESVV